MAAASAPKSAPEYATVFTVIPPIGNDNCYLKYTFLTKNPFTGVKEMRFAQEWTKELEEQTSLLVDDQAGPVIVFQKQNMYQVRRPSFVIDSKSNEPLSTLQGKIALLALPIFSTFPEMYGQTACTYEKVFPSENDKAKAKDEAKANNSLSWQDCFAGKA